MSEINVVPYIDVMLVLLIIFMITAPLITEGVKVDLPQADAQPLSTDAEDPLIIVVNQAGELFLSHGKGQEESVDAETLKLRVMAILQHNPKTPVLVRGDKQVDYGQVVRAMVLAQAAGATGMSLLTTPLDSPR